nr:hypothetical protein [uncultured Pseudogulbenkiania sp.]
MKDLKDFGLVVVQGSTTQGKQRIYIYDEKEALLLELQNKKNDKRKACFCFDVSCGKRGVQEMNDEIARIVVCLNNIDKSLEEKIKLLKGRKVL